MAGPHDKLIASAGKLVLGPIGLRRKGQSRLWVADHGWWLAMVEFQPSGWSKGSYLNVVAHWLWNPFEDRMSFDYHPDEQRFRKMPFVKYLSDDQFAPEAMRLAHLAAGAVEQLRSTFKTVESAALLLCEFQEALSEDQKGGWSAYHAAVALGLTGKLEAAKSMLAPIKDKRILPHAEVLRESLDNGVAAFGTKIEEFIARQRNALRLDTKR